MVAHPTADPRRTMQTNYRMDRSGVWVQRNGRPYRRRSVTPVVRPRKARLVAQGPDGQLAVPRLATDRSDPFYAWCSTRAESELRGSAAGGG
jgi:hypothetical protein